MKNAGLSLGLLTFFINFLASLGLQKEIYLAYSRFIFPVIRTIYDNTIGNLPFPSFYLPFFGLIIYLITFLYNYFKSNKINNNKHSCKSIMLFIASALGWIYFLFNFLWAFNYYRPSLESTLELPKIEIDSNILVNELTQVTETLNSQKSHLVRNKAEWNEKPDLKKLEDDIRISQVDLIHGWGDELSGRVRVRLLYPKGLLLSISTAGVYIPFSCEGHIDPGMHPLQWPFTIAHEMAHGYGYTDEGECNFIGFLTCIQTKDAYIQYSGWLGYWRYLFFQAKELSPEIAAEIYCNLTPEVVSDLTAIRRDLNNYPDIFPWLRDAMYDYYLKSQGIDKGLQSYEGIISLVLSWKNSKWDL